MSDLTERQFAVLRMIGQAADELAFRGQAMSRAIKASRAHRQSCLQRLRKIASDIEHTRLREHARVNPGAAAELTKLDHETKTLASRSAEAEEEQEELRQRLHDLAPFTASLTATLEAVLRRARLTREDIGVPFGSDIPHSGQADVVITDEVPR